MTIALPIMQTLAQCLFDALDDSPFPLPTDRVGMRFGQNVFPDVSRMEDECCPGVAWVRLVGTDATPLRGSENVMFGCANHQRTTTVELAVFRCMPTPGPDVLITGDQWADVATKAESDHTAMEQAVCCLNDVPPQVMRDFGVIVRVGAYVPVGPDANCVGATLLLTLEHDCGCGG